MPILEICLLKTKPHLFPTSPLLLSALQKARLQLRSKVVNTNSRFYQCTSDPSSIYILGVWPSLARHKEFLLSSHKAEILDEQDELFDFQWIIHTEIGNGMDDVPLEAPVMGIERVFVKSEGVERYREVVDRCRGTIEDGMKPYRSVMEWRVDCEEGKFEHVFVTGWKGEGDHAAFMKRMMEEQPDYARVRENCEGMEVSLARDMEGTN